MIQAPVIGAEVNIFIDVPPTNFTTRWQNVLKPYFSSFIEQLNRRLVIIQKEGKHRFEIATSLKVFPDLKKAIFN